jgi:hypothetical protein
MSSSNQVNRPTNLKVKQADVDRKLQLYGIITGKFSIAQQYPLPSLTILQPSKMARSHP